MAPHGTRARYEHRTNPCHCALCTEANRNYQRGYRLHLRGSDLSAFVAGSTTTWAQPALPGL
jgi:hypothetical protein